MATTSLGRLTLDLAVRLSEFTDGMSRAERETQDRTQRMQESVTSFREHLASELGGTQLGSIIDSFNERFGSIEGGITKVGAAFAGIAVGGIAVGLGALSKMAIETAKADAQMAVFANRANTTVANFQTLATASEGLGVNQEQLASILADTQEKLGEFTATGAGGASDFFDALKNNTKMTDDQIKAFGKTLTGKDGVEAIQIIKNKLDEMGASAQEQRFVFESLGSDLGNLSVIFANGGEIYKKYGDALKESGVLKTQEAIKQSQLLAAQTQAVHQRFDGLKSQLAGAMMPALNGLLQYFLKGIDKGGSLGGVIQGVGIIARTVAGAVIVLSSAVSIFGSTVGQYFAQLTNVAQTAVNVWNADGMEAKMQALSQGWSTAKGMLGDYVSDVTGKFQNAQQSVLGMINNNITQTDTWTQANLALIQSQNKLTNGMGKSTKQANDEADAKDKAAKSTLNHAKALEKLQARLVGISGNSGIGSGAHLDIRVSGGTRRLKASELARFQADGKPLTAYRKTSDYGYRGNIGVNGASKYHRGIDFAMPVGTPISSKVPVKDVRTFFDKNGGGYVSRVLFADGLSVDLLHQSPQIQGLKRGSSNMDSPYARANDEAISLNEKYQNNEQSERKRKEEQDRRDREQQAKELVSLTQYYATAAEKIESDHVEQLEKIHRLGVVGSKKYKELMARETQRYEDAKFDYQINKALQYASDEERITLEHTKKLRQINRDFANDPTERDRRVALENESYKKDVANFKWAQGEKARAQQALSDKIRDDISKSTMQSTNDYLDSTMKASMSPEQYSKWRLQQDYQRDASNVMAQYSARDAQINEVDKEGNFVLNDQQRYEAQLAARQEYYSKLYALDVDYASKYADLEKQKADLQKRQAEEAFSAQTEAARAFFGEKSAIYRGAAAMERAYAVYEATLNIDKTRSAVYTAISAIPLVGPYLAGPMSWAAAGIQIASAAKIKGLQVPQISGIAHGGLDYVPKETTFLLDEGERVLSPRQNKDLTRYLNERQANTGGNVNVYNNSSAQVTAERQPNGEVTIEVVDKMIKRSWGNVAQASSFESRQIQKHTTARFNRQ
ncbi:hypothetical protein KZX29_00025 [Moraxella osloensis]|uniref:hypothetical protein n=1 Tax=Faucicola osloensis TaxID=34062 RepID=UPI0020056A0A|nr:hypothetical protein [Moraxella osloensis]MCK6157193.1 hypothetical protein [Moraxella osloensis]